MKPTGAKKAPPRAPVANSQRGYPNWANCGRTVDASAPIPRSEAWTAILRRDRLYDGKFVYGAVTTGIYCRPSCPGRHPHVRNTILFPNAEDAVHAGFFACSRCCPAANSLTVAEHCIKAALAYLEKNFDRNITLAALSKYTGFSANHLQETFRRIIGLTPKAFCNAKRLAHFKQRLRSGESILQAGYAVGYGSSRAIYENAKKTLGMTPAVYRRGAAGLKIRYSIADGESTRVLVAATRDGVCAVLLGEDEIMIRELREEFPRAALNRDEMPSSKIITALEACRKEDPLISQLPLLVRRQVFLSRIHIALLHDF